MSDNSFQFGSFFAEKVLGISPKLLSPEARALLFSSKMLAKVLTPSFVTDLKRKKDQLKRDYGSKQAVQLRRFDVAEDLEYNLGIKHATNRDKIEKLLKKIKYKEKLDSKDRDVSSLIRLMKDEGDKDGVRKLLKLLSKGPIKTSDRAFNDILSNSSPRKSSGFAEHSYTNRIIPSDHGFKPNYSGMASTPESFAAFLARDQQNSSNSGERQRGAGKSLLSNSTTNLLEVQLDTYALLKGEFKNIDKNLKDILKAIDKIDVEGGSGILEALGLGGAAAAAKKGIDKVKPLAKKLPKIVKGLGPAATIAGAGISAKADFDSIKKAEELGLFTPEQAKTLRKKVLVTQGVSAVGGVGGAAVGALAGTPGVLAGSYLGSNFGEELGAGIAEGVYGSKVDRSTGYLATVASMESSLKANPNATGTTNAKGLFQFIPKTWNDLNKKYKKGWDLGGAQDPRLDPKKSIEMMNLLTRENQLALESKLGRKVTDTELYSAHFLGTAGAGKLLTSSNDSSAVDLLPQAAAANRSIFYNKSGEARSVGEVKSLLATKYGNNAARLGLSPNATVSAIKTSVPVMMPPVDELIPAEANPNITDEAMKEYSKNEVNKAAKAQMTQEKISSAIDRISKGDGSGLNSSSQALQNKAASIRSGGRVGGNSTTIVGQTAMSDINSIHFTDGMLLNVLTD